MERSRRLEVHRSQRRPDVEVRSRYLYHDEYVDCGSRMNTITQNRRKDSRRRRSTSSSSSECQRRFSRSQERGRQGYSSGDQSGRGYRCDIRRSQKSRSRSHRKRGCREAGWTLQERQDSRLRKRHRTEGNRHEIEQHNGYSCDNKHLSSRRENDGFLSPAQLAEDNGILRHEDDRQRKRRSQRRRRRHRRKHQSRRSASSSSTVSSQSIPRRTAGVVSDDEDIEPRKGAIFPAASTDERGIATTGTKTSWDDSVGHFRGGKGSLMADRYRIIREVGMGTFGRVVECLDLKRKATNRNVRNRPHDPYVAIKVVRNIKRYYDSALIEAGLVAEINRQGGRGLSHCVIMYDSFPYDEHYCMVFECLGPSLYDFLKRHNHQPFPMVCIRDFTIQLLETLEFLHSLRLIHTDLKVENILLTNDREVKYGNHIVPESTRIKVIDFGGACYDHDKKSSIINTRQYRAPEVILGTGWSMPSDMWSVGCILTELYQGELLFATHDNIEHVALIEQTIGYFPRHMIKEAKYISQNNIAREAFDSSGRHRMDRALDAEKCDYVRRTPRLEQIVRNPQDSWFLSLLRLILDIDPAKRATAHECLQILSRKRMDVVLYS